MNSKLTKVEYQHMIISLINESIRDFGYISDNYKEESVDWIYFLEMLRNKGVAGDISPVMTNVEGKARTTSRAIKQKFDDEREYYITTLI